MRLDFDRGTLLIDTEPGDPALDLRELPGVRWDPRVARHRAPAYLRRELYRTLKARGVRLSGPAAERPKPVPGRWKDGFALRDYQQAAIDAWAAAGLRGVVVLPTGSGKTRTACAAMARHPLPALVLVPTRVLLHQWSLEIGAWYRGRVARFGDGLQEVGPVTVATYASMWRHVAEIGHRFSVLVVDEVHHFATGRWAEILEMCPAGLRLGLTATLPVEARAGVEVTLGPVVYSRALTELAGEALAPFERRVVEVHLPPETLAAYARDHAQFREAWDRFRRANPGGVWREFIRACKRSDDGRDALAAWERCRARLAFPEEKRAMLARILARHRGDRVLVFAEDNATVYRVAREHLIAPVTCDVGAPERDALFERFRDGRIRALVSAKVLNEGLDVPAADVAVVVAGRGGLIEHVQRVGRVLRPAPGKRALVYELVVTGTADAGRAARRWEALHAA